MKHGIGIQSSIWNNNLKSLGLLFGFPLVVMFMVWICALAAYLSMSFGITIAWERAFNLANEFIYSYWHWVLGCVCVWFFFAWCFHQKLINRKVHAVALERKENVVVHRLLENLCISRGMRVPQLFVIETEALNAFASGLSEKTAAITLTRGLINQLEEDELEAVLAHELTHIIHKDTRLLVIAIIFVGIIGTITNYMVRGVFTRRVHHSGARGSGHMLGALMVLVVGFLGGLMGLVIRLAISRRREFMADAGAVQLTKDSDALIRALEKITQNSVVEDIDDTMRVMMIHYPSKKKWFGLARFFSTHPPTEDRIAVLKHY